MKTDSYELNDKLKQIYEKVRTEVGMDLTLPALIANRDLWSTDISHSIKKTIWYLLRAETYEHNCAEQIEEYKNAELVIRDLVAQLLTEPGGFPTQKLPPKPRSFTKWYYAK